MLVTPQVHLIDAAGSSSASYPVCVQSRTAGLEYFVEHWRGHLLLLTNRCSTPTASQSACSHHPSHDAHAQRLPRDIMSEVDSTTAAAAAAGSADPGDYSLMTLPAALVGSAGADSWRLLLPVQPGAAVTDMDVFDSRVVLHEVCSAQPGLRLLQLTEEAGQQQPELQVLQQQQQVSRR
jgi:protease II